MKISEFYKMMNEREQFEAELQFEEAYRDIFSFCYGAALPVTEAKQAIEDWMKTHQDKQYFAASRDSQRNSKASANAGY